MSTLTIEEMLADMVDMCGNDELGEWWSVLYALNQEMSEHSSEKFREAFICEVNEQYAMFLEEQEENEPPAAECFNCGSDEELMTDGGYYICLKCIAMLKPVEIQIGEDSVPSCGEGETGRKCNGCRS